MRLFLPLALVACNRGFDDLSADVSPVVGTVVTVTWSTKEPTVGYVEYGAGGAFSMETPREPKATTEHSVTLLGLTPLQEVTLRAVSVDGDRTRTSEEVTVTTEALPGSLAPPIVTGEGNDQHTISTLIGAQTGPVILTPEGEYSWFFQDEEDPALYRIRARAARDGTGIYYNVATQDADENADPAIVKVSWDGQQVERIPVHLLAHDFVELPDGTLAAIVAEIRDEGGEEVVGAQIVEISPQDGAQATVWSAWDCFNTTDHESREPALGWAYANALDYDAEDDAYYLSIRSFNSIVKIDRASGECRWGLGGEAGTMDISGARFLHQHQFHVDDGRILVFDNDGGSTETDDMSRVIEYSLNEEAGEVEEIGTYVADPPIWSYVLGDVERLANDDVMVAWSVAGQLNRFTPAGEVTWQVSSPLGLTFGFADFAGDLYTAGE